MTKDRKKKTHPALPCQTNKQIVNLDYWLTFAET